MSLPIDKRYQSRKRLFAGATQYSGYSPWAIDAVPVDYDPDNVGAEDGSKIRLELHEQTKGSIRALLSQYDV